MACGSSWWSWPATVCAVAALSVALLAPFILYPLLRADDTDALLAHAGRFSTSSAIVVPGAWRVPRTPEMRRRGLPGRLSRAYTQRLDRAVRVAAATGIADIVLSGGNGDSVLARRWVVERFGAGPAASASAPPDDDDPTTIDGPLVSDAMLRLPTEEEQGLRWPPHREGAAAATAPFRVRLWIENRSTTTATNAVETAALLRNVTWAHDEPCIACGGAAERRRTTSASGAERDQEALSSALVVVSSPYHQARCRLFFGPVVDGSSLSDAGGAGVTREGEGRRRLFFVGSAADEYENLVPADPAWIEARTVFNEEPDPTPAAEASCRRPHCIFVRHPRWPLGAMLPKSALDAFQSYLASWRAFTNVARVTAWSTTAGAWMREAGALVVNLLQRKYGLGDLVHLR